MLRLVKIIAQQSLICQKYSWLPQNTDKKDKFKPVQMISLL